MTLVTYPRYFPWRGRQRPHSPLSCCMFSMVTLLVSGVGIMNIMLATVRSRIREIGIRKALGATFREIQLQFLAEAVLISLSGGVVGTVLAMLLPLSIAFFTDYRLQVSWLSAVIAILVSCAVGSPLVPFPQCVQHEWIL